MPTKSSDFKIIDLPEGGKRFEFFSLANNEGYGKLYVQEVNAQGKIMKEFKDTIGPEGLIERKFITGS